jgi:ParB family chromosome partitioning protein
VDEGRIAFTPATELSYLAEKEQRDLLDTMESEDCTPSLSQAQRMKRLSQEGHLNMDVIFAILTEEKANQKEKLKIPVERVRDFFPKDYTAAQMEETIVKMCEDWYRKKMRDRDAR